MAKPFAINVVICTYGRSKLLRRTLQSLSQATRPRGFELVWVIENGPECGTRGVCSEMQSRLPLRYIHLNEKGKSRALQYAMDQIGEGLVIFTDDDVRVGEGFLQAYATAAAAHDTKAFFGGPLSIDYERKPPDWLLPKMPPSVTGWERVDPDQPITEACFLGANYGGFVEQIQAVGGFKAELGIGSEGNPVGEEFEIQDRMLAAGYQGVYVPDARVWHYVPKKRSSPRWTLHRYERIWLTSALTGNDHNEKPWLAGVPRWMIKRLVALWFKAMGANFILDGKRRFEAKMLYHQWRGTVYGVRLRHEREAS